MSLLDSGFLVELTKQLSSLFEKASKEVLLVVASIFILMNYWFISIFLLARHFLDAHFWITVDISFILAITWFTANFSFSALILSGAKEALETLGQKPVGAVPLANKIVGTLANTVLYLSFILFICYYAKSSYLCFLLCCLSYIALLGLATFIYYRIKMKNNTIEQLPQS